jgi:hypothetical protein
MYLSAANAGSAVLFLQMRAEASRIARKIAYNIGGVFSDS